MAGRPPRLDTLAKELGVTRGRVSQMKAKGMPVHSIEAAREWRDANVQRRVVIAGERPTEITAMTYDIAEARAKREHHEANIAAMREAQLAGALVSRDRVESAVTALAAQARSGFERLPDKLSDVLAAEGDAHRIHGLLIAEIDQVLADLEQQAANLELVDTGTRQ
jgi:hypothetical protein